jgi:ketosteroid isomerase-like protein
VKLLSVLSALLLAAPRLSAAQTAVDRDVEDIKNAMVQMWAAEEAGDIERYASFIHPSFTQFGETAEYLSEGKELEVRSMGEYLQRAKNVHTVMHHPQVTVRGTVAWVTYYWTDEGIVDGKRTTSRGKSTRIFVKENGKWLCIHGHYTLAP